MMKRSQPALARTTDVIQRGISDGLHLGAQLYLSTAEGFVADQVFGEARPGQAMSNDDLVPWLSAGKPLTAVAIMQLVERGKLHLDDPVARHIPEFAQHGKDAITIRHLLTHTAGIRNAALNPDRLSWDQVIAEICSARPEPRWIAGKKAGYHGSSSWFVLGELIQRLSNEPFTQYLRRAVLEPLEMLDSWLGMPAERHRAYGKRMVPVFDSSGASFDADQYINSQAGAVNPNPGANARGPIRELGIFYESLRDSLLHDKATILKRQTIQQMVARHRQGLADKTFGSVIDWGLGFILNGTAYNPAVLYNFGPHASEATFGHSGNQSSCAFCDPQRGLVVAWMCNGMPGELAHQPRQRQINAAVYEDLGLT